MDPSDIRMHVIVQEMIDADVSGVAFSVNPTRPFRPEKLVSAVYGLGEGLVSGELSSDNFIYHKPSKKWAATASGESRKLKYNGDSLVYEPLSEMEVATPCLSEKQLNQILQTIDRLEQYYGSPQDVEFCYRDNTLYLLQSRPITTIQKIRDHIIWDNSNIVESYPGITSHFTFSFILGIYESVYRNLALLLGVPGKQIEANSTVFAQMLGHINGRVYYHLINWYKALAMLPAYSLNAGFMEKMMGVSEPLGVSFTLEKQPSRLMSVWYTLKTVFRILRLNKRLPGIKKEFTLKVNQIIDDYNHRDYASQSTQQIWSDFKAFKKVLVNEWSPPLINDLLAMVYFGSLQKLCSNWLNDDAIHTQLIIGKHTVKSAEPALLIEKIVQTACQENAFDQSILPKTEEEVWELCKSNQLGNTGRLILDYINAYGDRSVGELKLENETFRQNPASFITILKSYAAQTYSAPPSPNHNPSDSSTTKHLPFPKSAILKYVERKAAEMVADRENLRFDRTRAFGVVRHLIFLIGERFEADKILENKHDVFLLKEEEVGHIINGKLNPEDIRILLKKRRQEVCTYDAMDEPPERIHEYNGTLDLDTEPETLPNELKGIPCSPGVIEAPVRILESPDDVKSLNGDILVTTSTDPGWITIFRSASAILVERGSTLSHAAIVSREMGIPCIVGIKGVTRMLKSGDRVRMDGQTGIVTPLEQ